MGIIDHTIDIFEKRVSELDKIGYSPALPRWTDADVIAANCLIIEYRNLTSHSSRAAGACVFLMSCDDFKVGCAESCLRYRLPPA